MKKIKRIILLLLVVLLVSGCEEKNKENDKSDTKKETSIDERIEKDLSNMTLDEKIGQMMIIFYRKGEMDNILKSSLETVKPGGFILFKENFTTYDDTLKLIKEIKESATIPMFISIDQEGGNVQRLKGLQDTTVSNIPYMYDVGLINDEELAKKIGNVIAEELKVFGINMDFAPDIDVFSNPNNTVIGKRSFGTTEDLVSKMGNAVKNGLEEKGIVAVYKHFPGHGNTETDSHVSLPIVTKSKEELMKSDLVPFINAINNGADVIMLGHLAVPAITGDNTPASLSKKMVTGFLKEELNYKGLVITDALNMGALTNYYTQEEIYVQAINAGVDILLMPSSSKECLNTIREAVKNGKITEERIDESVRKILKLKYEKIEKNYNEYLPKETLNSIEHQEILSNVK